MNAVQDPIQVHLPDGSLKQFAAGVTPFQVAESISPRLAAASVVARIKPIHAAINSTTEQSGEEAMYSTENAHAQRLVDLSTPLNEDVELELLTEKSPDA